MTKNMEEYPDPTLEDSHRFWELLDKRHPEIGQQLQHRIFIDTSIVAFQPATMLDSSYSIFNRFLRRWFADNGFMKPQPDIIHVSLNDGDNMSAREIDTSTIVSIKGINEKLTSVEIKEPDMDKNTTIIVKEFVEVLRKEIYIF